MYTSYKRKQCQQMCWCRLRQIACMHQLQYQSGFLVQTSPSLGKVCICAPFHMCTSPIYVFTQNQPDAYIHVTHACIWLRNYYFMCESQQRTDGDENQDENSKLLKISKLKSWLTVGKVLDTFTDLHTAMYMLQCCYVWTLVQIAWSAWRGSYTGTLHLLSSFIFSSVSRLSSFKQPRALLAHLTAVSTPPFIHSSLSFFVIVHISKPTASHLCVPQPAHQLLSLFLSCQTQRWSHEFKMSGHLLKETLSVSSFSGAEIDRLVWQQRLLLSADLPCFACLFASNAADLNGGTNIWTLNWRQMWFITVYHQWLQ